MFEKLLHVANPVFDKVEDAQILLTEDATYRIMYNQFNIDSCYAATLVAEYVMHCNPSASVSTVSVDYFNYQKPVNKTTVLILCGVNLTVRDMLSELELSAPELALRFIYSGHATDEFISPVNQCKFVNITPNNDEERSADQVEHITSDNSISVLVNDYFGKTFGSSDMSAQQARLLSAVAGYINMRPFPSIFEKKPDEGREKSNFIVSGRIGLRDKDDLSFLYSNKEAIEEMARLGKPHLVLMSEVETVRNYSSNLTTAKNIIHRNMSEQIYSGKSKYFKAQTVCVGEENTFEVMRLLSLALPTVVTYEDMQNYRVWRLICSNQSTLEIAREALKPVMEWVDCKVNYLVTHLTPPMGLQK